MLFRSSICSYLRGGREAVEILLLGVGQPFLYLRDLGSGQPRALERIVRLTLVCTLSDPAP